MKYRFLSFLFFITISSSLFSQVVPVWQNYIGGIGSEQLVCSEVLSNGDLLVGGYSTSSSFGNQSGTGFQLGGGLSDGFLARISPNGNLIWWTMYGGNANDFIYSMKEAGDGSIWVLGGTTGEISTSINALRSVNSTAPLYDIFVAHFNGDGGFEGATLLGGDGDDKPIALGFENDSIVILGYTTSIGLGLGEVNDLILNNESAGFIAVLNDLSSLSSFSYFEFDGDVFDSSNGLTGFQCSDGDFIFYRGTNAIAGVATDNAQFPDPLSVGNGFITKLNTSGEQIWGTFANHVGSNRFTSSLGDDLFATFGTTYEGIDMATNNSYQQELLGQRDGFISLWKQTGELVWSTYLGFDELTVSGEVINTMTYEDGRIFFGGFMKEGGNLATSDAWIDDVEGVDASKLGVFGWFNYNGELEYCSYVVSPGAFAEVLTSNVDNSNLYLGLKVQDYATWAESVDTEQQFWGETDLCVLAFKLPTNLIEVDEEIPLITYPNPTTDQLYFTGVNVVGATVVVYDSQGREVLREKLQSSLQVSSLDSGYYFGTLITSQGSERTFKFVK